MLWLLAVFGILLACDSPGRPARLEALGPELGLAFHEELTPASSAAIEAMPSLRARSQNFFVRALESEDVLVFDWVRRDGRLKDRDRESRTVIAVRTEGRELPAFVWVRRGRIEREEQRRLGESLDFGSPDAFSDAYDVFGLDRAGLRALFSDPLRKELELPPGLHVEGAGSWWIGYRPGRVIPAEEIAARIEEMKQVVAPFARRSTASPAFGR